MSSTTAPDAEVIATAAPTADNKSDRFPAGIPFIVGNEGAERFSFYGMKAILYVYLTALYLRFVTEAGVGAEQLAAAKAHGTEVVHLFVAGVYMFPLIGAVLADRLLGKYRVIFWVSMIYCAGHAVLAVAGRMGALGQFGAAEWAAYMGLGLIALGSGGIKPCVSANVGDQFTAANGHLVTKVFQIFYFIINYGSFFSTLLTPVLYKNFGPEVAFGVPGILMGIATIVFWMGRNRFTRVPPKPGGKVGLLDTFATIFLFSPFFALIYGYFVKFASFSTTVGTQTVTGEMIFDRFIGLFGIGTQVSFELGPVLAALFAYYVPMLAVVAAAFALGLILFNIRQRIAPDDGFLAVLLYAFRSQKQRKPGQGFFGPAAEKFGEEAAEGPPAVLRIMLVFSMVSVFWALFDQHASTWVEQAKQMGLGVTMPYYLGWYGLVATIALSFAAGLWLMLWVSNTVVPSKVIRGVLGAFGLGLVIAAIADAINGEWMSFDLLPSQLSALNPLMVMAIIPLLNVAVYAPLRKRGIEVKPLQKMTVGMFLAAFAFVIAGVLQAAVEAAGVGKVHALWQFFPYLIMTTAEVLVSITGLEFAYTQAPRRMKSTIMGFWLLCVTFGNLLVAFLAPLQKVLQLSAFFWAFAGLMLVGALVFSFLAYTYKGKSYLQPEA